MNDLKTFLEILNSLYYELKFSHSVGRSRVRCWCEVELPYIVWTRLLGRPSKFVQVVSQPFNLARVITFAEFLHNSINK